MPTSPSFLVPIGDTFTEKVPDNLIRTEMDVGPAKVRRRTTANVRDIQFRSWLTPAQTEDLDTFFMRDVYSGALPFDYTHPRTGAVVSARFKEPPTYTDVEAGMYYEASISLEILP